MSNAYTQVRTAATMGIVAILATGNIGVARDFAVPHRKTNPLPTVRLGFNDGSHGQSRFVQSSAALSGMEQFNNSISAFYSSLTSKQKSLDIDMARAISDSEWDLYETE